MTRRDEQEIRELASTWMAATRAGDVETVLSLMADDVVFLVPGQAQLTVVVTPPGGAPSTTRAGHTLSILKKEAGKWVLARDANLLAPVLP